MPGDDCFLRDLEGALTRRRSNLPPGAPDPRGWGRGEEMLRGDLAPEPLDHHGTGEGQVAVDVAQGEVKTVLVAFVILIPLGVEGRHRSRSMYGTKTPKKK